MAAEMPGVPVVRRGGDMACDIACICWPAHAIGGFAAMHPMAAGAIKVSFCNGVWAVADGADHAGICYVRACNKGDHAKPGYKGWRVGRADVAAVLRSKGLGVVLSRGGHGGFLWGKALYLLPLALACTDRGTDAKMVVNTVEYAEWYDVVRRAAVTAVGETVVTQHEPRVRYLCERTPRGWHPSPTAEELAYFRGRLCAD